MTKDLSDELTELENDLRRDYGPETGLYMPAAEAIDRLRRQRHEALTLAQARLQSLADLSDELQAVKRKLDEAIKALEWYADYVSGLNRPSPITGDSVAVGMLKHDGGERALAALALLKRKP